MPESSSSATPSGDRQAADSAVDQRAGPTGRAGPRTGRYSTTIGTFIARLQATLPVPASGTAFALPAHARRYKVRGMLEACGAGRLQGAVLLELAGALALAALHTDTVLNDPAVAAEHWVRVARLPFEPPPPFFDREAHLQTFLLGTIGSYGPLKNLRLIRKEYRLATGGRIDLLCEEVRRDGRGQLVAIELKRASDEGTAEQIIRYVRDLRQEPIAVGRLGVRGMVITGERDEIGAGFAKAHAGVDITWWQYAVSLEAVS